jgi:hypothetical protein
MDSSIMLRNYVFRLALPVAVLGIAAYSVGQESTEESLPAESPVPTGRSPERLGRSLLPVDESLPTQAIETPVADEPAAEGFGTDGFSRAEYSVESQGLMIVWSRKNGKLSGFSRQTGDWSHLAVAPHEFINEPILGGKVGAVRVGDTVAAFSGTTGTWDVLRSRAQSKEAPRIEIASSDLVKVKVGVLLYTFAAASGKWTSPNDSDFGASTASKPISAQPAVRGPLAPSFVPAPGIISNNPFRSPGSSPFDQEAMQLARRYRENTQNDAVARKTLTDAVTIAFDKRQAFQRSEAERMQAKLKKIQQAIASRDKLRPRIIERRVEELLDPDVNWDTTSADRNLPVPGGLVETGAFTRTRPVPVTETPVGLPGPPHIPYGGLSTLRTGNVPPVSVESAPWTSITWRQPGELFKQLADRRRFVHLSVDSINDLQPKLKAAQRSLSELRTLKEWQDMTEADRQRSIGSVARNIRRCQEELVRSLGQWKQEWSLYQSQLKLLHLDVEEALIRRDAARKDAERVRQLAENGVTTDAEQRKADTELAVSGIALKRAELILAPYATIEADMSELDPTEFDSELLLKDPVRETMRSTLGR